MCASSSTTTTDPLFVNLPEPVEQNLPPIENLTEDPVPPSFLDIVKIEQPDTPEASDGQDYDSDGGRRERKKKRLSKAQRTDETAPEEEDAESVASEGKANASVTLTVQELAEWSDVVKMNDYLLNNGRRPQFWEEAFTKRVLEAIKNKTLEMKKAAEILGVSYGTLYGRYREAYGCLKDPYR